MITHGDYGDEVLNHSCVKESEGSYAGPLGSRTPSWSWASINGAIRLPAGLGWKISDVDGKLLVRIVDVTSAPIKDFPLEGIPSKKLRLVCGPLFGVKETVVARDRGPPGRSCANDDTCIVGKLLGFTRHKVRRAQRSLLLSPHSPNSDNGPALPTSV